MSIVETKRYWQDRTTSLCILLDMDMSTVFLIKSHKLTVIYYHFSACAIVYCNSRHIYCLGVIAGDFQQ